MAHKVTQDNVTKKSTQNNPEFWFKSVRNSGIFPKKFLKPVNHPSQDEKHSRLEPVNHEPILCVLDLGWQVLICEFLLG